MKFFVALYSSVEIVWNYSQKTTALQKLLKEKQSFVLKCEDQNELLTQKVIWKFYDVSKPAELHTDASEGAKGAVPL